MLKSLFYWYLHLEPRNFQRSKTIKVHSLWYIQPFEELSGWALKSSSACQTCLRTLAASIRENTISDYRDANFKGALLDQSTAGGLVRG